MQKDSSRRRFPLADRLIEVIDDTLTGEVLLDEALKMMKGSEKMSVSSWIDLMSGADHFQVFSTSHHTNSRIRRNMEPNEDRLPTKASARAISKRTGR